MVVVDLCLPRKRTEQQVILRLCPKQPLSTLLQIRLKREITFSFSIGLNLVCALKLDFREDLHSWDGNILPLSFSWKNFQILSHQWSTYKVLTLNPLSSPMKDQ